MKYTPAGGTITITATPDDPNGDQKWITWTVADTGLGLVITRAIIERHGGTITLTDHGPGTTFRIRVPTKPPEINA